LICLFIIKRVNICNHQITQIFTRKPFLERKALPTTFLPSVKTLTKNILFIFLLAQVFFFREAFLIKLFLKV